MAELLIFQLPPKNLKHKKTHPEEMMTAQHRATPKLQSREGPKKGSECVPKREYGRT